MFARLAARHAPPSAPSSRPSPPPRTTRCAPASSSTCCASGFSAQEARNQLDTAIDWGCYAELYDYDSDDEELTLEPGASDYL